MLNDNERLFVKIIESLDILGKSTSSPLMISDAVSIIEQNNLSSEYALMILDEYAPDALNEDNGTLNKLSLIIAYNKIKRKERSGETRITNPKIKNELTKIMSDYEPYSLFILKKMMKKEDPNEEFIDYLNSLVSKGEVFVNGGLYRLHKPLQYGRIEQLYGPHHDSILSVNRAFILHKQELNELDIRNKTEFRAIIPHLNNVDFWIEDDDYISFNDMDLDDLIEIYETDDLYGESLIDFLSTKFDIDYEILQKYIWVDDEDDYDDEYLDDDQSDIEITNEDPLLDQETIQRLKKILTDSFYDLEEYTSILRNNLENFTTDLATDAYCRKLGYKRHSPPNQPNSQCIYKYEFSNPTEAFRDSLEDYDGYIFVPLSRMNNDIVKRELKALIKNGYLFQIDDGDYITEDKLNDILPNGLADLDEFNEEVANKFKDRTFCVKQLEGMIPNEFMKISQKDSFYESILMSSYRQFYTRRIQNTTLFNSMVTPTVANIIIEIIEEEGGVIELGELSLAIEFKYGIKETENDLKKYINDASIPYQDVGEETLIYLDHDVFLEIAGYDSTD